MEPKNFFFNDDIQLDDAENTFAGHLPKDIHSAIKLLESIEIALRFPSYFGCNWNALYDCLRDFDWIEAKTIYLIHHDLPSLIDDELKIYLEILRDASEDWQHGESHELRIIFPSSEKNRVLQLLSSP